MGAITDLTKRILRMAEHEATMALSDGSDAEKVIKGTNATIELLRRAEMLVSMTKTVNDAISAAEKKP